MSGNTIRRLSTVAVALLVICSFAGGPVAAATAGTFGDSVSNDLSADDSTDDDSADDSTDDDSADDSTDDDSADDSTDDDSEDTSTQESTDDSDDGSDDGSEESTDDSTADNASDLVTETVNGSVETADSSVETTVDGTTTAGFSLLSTVSDTTGLQSTLGLPSTGFQETERVDRSRLAAEQYGAATGSDDDDEAAVSDGAADDGSAPLVGAIGPVAAASVTGSGTDGEPLPAGVSGGATLGLGALAAVAVARSTPLFAGSTASSTGSATTGYLASLLDKVKPFVFPLRYSRYDDSDPLEHEAREMVYEIVNETPGSYLSEVSEQAGLPLSTTRHHMKILEREELVSGAKLRGKRRFYPAYAEGIELAAALNDDSTASIIDALARLGAASVSDLADDLGRDPSTISHHLQRLEEDDIITREREGRAVMNKLSGEARTAMAPETTPRPGEAAEAIAD